MYNRGNKDPKELAAGAVGRGEGCCEGDPGFPEGSVVKICLPTRETPVRSLIWEDSACLGQRSPCAATTEPVLQSSGVALTEPANPGAWAPQQEKPQ